ncbi:glycerol-3-phosphate 1-O-acyltransferase PlsY [Acidobacteriota bacterium]
MNGLESLFFILAMIMAYLLGAIPFGYIIYKIRKGDDIRETGSGNIGATNVYRSAGRAFGLLTLLLDILKGILAVLIAKGMVEQADLALLAAPIAIAGHMFPVFLRFKGGKGVATALGAFAMIAPWALLVSIAVFLAVALAFRIISLASISAAAVFPLAAFLFEGGWILPVIAGICSLLIIVRHHTNISRIFRGTEKHIWRKAAQ